MLATALDSLLNRGPALPPGSTDRTLPTRHGRLRVRDSGGDKPVLLSVPDGPNVIEHHAALIEALVDDFRVVCFDMPGFGFSRPTPRYGHRLEQGAAVVLDVMDALDIPRASLAFSCANGFFAVAAAKAAPQRIQHLLLCQTPSLPAMRRWAERMIPTPLRVPLAGQLLMHAGRRRIAHHWYGLAIPQADHRPPYRAVAEQALADGACYCLASLSQGLLRARDDALRGVTTPATVIWGDGDRSHSRTSADAVLEMLPHAALHRFDGCGHFPELEQPARYGRIVRAALAAQAGV